MLFWTLWNVSQNPSTPSAWGMELSKFWLLAGQPLPVKPKEIALEISKIRFDDPISKIHGHDIRGIEGMLCKNSKGADWFILYDKTVEIQGRINFTLAHEFGHYLLHRALVDRFECGQSDMLDYDSPESKIREKEANCFASYLLMPITDYRQQIESQTVNLDLIAHCADRYDVSVTAAALKWIDLTDEVAIVVMARDDFICWSYPSKKAKKSKIYFPKGTPVPSNSISKNPSNQSNTSSRMAPGVWHSTHEAIESVIVSDKYDMAIFLVRFPFADIKDFEDEPETDTVDFLNYKTQG